MKVQHYYVYILTNSKNTVLYIGVTNNLIKRVWEHNNTLVESFTSKYKVKKLVYFETFQTIYEAITREKQLKNWHRAWKINLIKKTNTNFSDLYDELL